MIDRFMRKRLQELLSQETKRKVLCVFGPRQAGKTTLIQNVFEGLEGRKEMLNADFLDDRSLLVPERAALERIASHLDYLFIDEAQNLSQAGLVLKLLHDNFPTLRVVASGSAAFDLRRQTGEPLTGRQISLELLPVSITERSPSVNQFSTFLEHGMVYGGYPEVVTTKDPNEKQTLLRQLASDYLLKDIFAQVDINRDRLLNLLRLLAFQIGSEASLNEISRTLKMDVKTVDRYICLLEDAYVVFRLGGFSRNLRKEISKSRKVYFIDLGIRNALINAFNPLNLRNDVGQLWENLLLIERRKKWIYQGVHYNSWFWRTYDQQEIDYIEERDDKLTAIEFKWNSERKTRIPKLFRTTYPEADSVVITPQNAYQFLLG